ncbi:unnamed protein product [Chondrus crispus]|uniref:Uncharacterized protein n=1 Tax=Chondrus crispus TaxID=2769 RepID=R7QR35_CHOCR|nr:unnamed protein product [Chondrus crispus]CDF40584.1 unnamed protein product [Chondrus crispus]|eukprot:XP_005710878.1 unnamed protein product [Chondrus crispus]
MMRQVGGGGGLVLPDCAREVCRFSRFCTFTVSYVHQCMKEAQTGSYEQNDTVKFTWASRGLAVEGWLSSAAHSPLS